MATRTLPRPAVPARVAPLSRAATGSLALAGLVGAAALLALTAAAGPSPLVSTFRTMPHYFPAWLAGPLHAIGIPGSQALRIGLVVAFCACYATALRCAAAISSRRLWTAIVLAHVAVALAPPLLSADVFGYIGFARLESLHGLSPYAFTANAAPGDAIHPLLGWTDVTTPYGPLFTLLSMALVPLGIAGALWTLKALAALASLATVALIWRIARRLGHEPRSAAALYGLNPLVVIFAVGGAHNETLFGVALAAGALCVLVGGRERSGAVALAAATAIKASAALANPFALIGSQRPRRLALEGAVALAAALGAGVAVFGVHIIAIGAGAWLTQQHQCVAGHSLPSQVSKLLGLGDLALGVRVAFLAAFALALAGSLRRTWRGAPWIDGYGWATLALLGATAWILPWYGLWALLPASLSANRRLRLVTLGACAYLVAIEVLVAKPLARGVASFDQVEPVAPVEPARRPVEAASRPSRRRSSPLAPVAARRQACVARPSIAVAPLTPPAPIPVQVGGTSEIAQSGRTPHP